MAENAQFARACSAVLNFPVSDEEKERRDDELAPLAVRARAYYDSRGETSPNDIVSRTAGSRGETFPNDIVSRAETSAEMQPDDDDGQPANQLRRALEAIARTCSRGLSKILFPDDPLVLEMAIRGAALDCHPGILCDWISAKAKAKAKAGDPVRTYTFFRGCMEAELPAYLCERPGLPKEVYPISVQQCNDCRGLQVEFTDLVVPCALSDSPQRGSQHAARVPTWLPGLAS
jgi:hypothetical protein